MFYLASGMENHDDEVQERVGGRLISPIAFFPPNVREWHPNVIRKHEVCHTPLHTIGSVFQSAEFPDSSNDGPRGQS
jgi:hypothetical protein